MRNARTARCADAPEVARARPTRCDRCDARRDRYGQCGPGAASGAGRRARRRLTRGSCVGSLSACPPEPPRRGFSKRPTLAQWNPYDLWYWVQGAPPPDRRRTRLLEPRGPSGADVTRSRESSPPLITHRRGRNCRVSGAATRPRVAPSATSGTGCRARRRLAGGACDYSHPAGPPGADATRSRESSMPLLTYWCGRNCRVCGGAHRPREALLCN